MADLVTNIIKTTGNASELVPSENFLSLFEGAWGPLGTAMQVVNIALQAPGRGNTANFHVDEVVSQTSGSAGAITEGDDGIQTYQAWNPTENTVTVSSFATSRAVSARMIYEAREGANELMTQGIVNAELLRREKTILGTAVSSTNSRDDSGLTVDLGLWTKAQFEFYGNNPAPGSSGFAVVLHTNCMRDLFQALRTDGASVLANPAAAQFPVGGTNVNVQNPGLGIPYDGYTFYRTPNVAQFDSTSRSNLILSAGDGGSLAYLYEAIPGMIEFAGGMLRVDMTGPGSKTHADSYQIVSCKADYGAGIVRPAGFLEWVLDG